MESQQGWRMKLSYKNATILVCFFNLLTAVLLLRGYYAAVNERASRYRHIDPTQLRYIIESEEMRRAMEPHELIKRVKEIEREAYIVPESEKQKAHKQTAATDLSKRLNDFRSTNEASSQKALEEWRKRKMERARQREIEKNGTLASQT